MSNETKLPFWAVEQANVRELLRLTVNSYRANTLKNGLHRIEPGDHALAEGLLLAMEKVAGYVLARHDSDEDANALIEVFENDMTVTTVDELNALAEEFGLTPHPALTDFEGDGKDVIVSVVRDLLQQMSARGAAPRPRKPVQELAVSKDPIMQNVIDRIRKFMVAAGWSEVTQLANGHVLEPCSQFLHPSGAMIEARDEHRKNKLSERGLTRWAWFRDDTTMCDETHWAHELNVAMDLALSPKPKEG